MFEDDKDMKDELCRKFAGMLYKYLAVLCYNLVDLRLQGSQATTTMSQHKFGNCLRR
jgi:hypothetical protein